MKKKIAIWGASGHAMVVADIIRSRGDYKIVGFIDDINLQKHGVEFCGARILGGQEQLDHLRHNDVKHLIFGFGDCEARLRLSNFAIAQGFSLVTAVHPSAVIADGVPIGAGTVIGANVVIGPGSRIGENVIINTSASVNHECLIDDGAHICPGVHLGGRVHVNRSAWVGIGTTVIDRVRIGVSAFIGAGAVVVNDIPDGVMAFGAPAKIRKKKAPK